MKTIKELLLEKGRTFYNFGKKYIIWGFSIAGVALLVLLCFCEFDMEWLLDAILFMDEGFTHFLAIIIDLSIIVSTIGIKLYFKGVHYLGLGQIAENTEKESSVQHEVIALNSTK